MKHVLLRHINALTIFFKNDRRIENSLFTIKTVTLNYVFNVAKIIKYKIIKNNLTNNLLISNIEKKTLKRKNILFVFIGSCN